jgi:hypothetical protein
VTSENIEMSCKNGKVTIPGDKATSAEVELSLGPRRGGRSPLPLARWIKRKAIERAMGITG